MKQIATFDWTFIFVPPFKVTDMVGFISKNKP